MLKSSWVISHVNVELKTNVSELSSSSRLMVHGCGMKLIALQLVALYLGGMFAHVFIFKKSLLALYVELISTILTCQNRLGRSG
jgi:hypothetical protein